MAKKESRPIPDNLAATEFLQRWRAQGPWALTCIDVEKKGIETRTFRKENLTDLQKWLKQYNGRRNIYFHVNPTIGDITKKANREDIAELAWLHVDVDPRAGEDLEQERERALSLLSNPPDGIPPPTVIVFSGGGYQGFWKLEEPLPIGGDLGKAEEAKRYNLQLELMFGGDNCHNVDRIMRLPGTINIPDSRKRAKGRTEELATVVNWEIKNVYPLTKFRPAASVQMNNGSSPFSVEPDTQMSGNVERLNSVDDLEKWNVPDRIKVIIVQGRHPDEGPKPKDDSRSAWLFDAVCGLVRADVPDEIIYSIITDPDFGISGSVLDKGTNSEKYALRQITQAKEESIDPNLRMLNDRHAVIGNMGGKCRVIEEIMDHGLGRTRITKQTFEDFRNRYMNRMTQVGTNKDGGPVMKPLGEWWLKHPLRRQFDSVVFAPNREIHGAYNLWKGFACDAKPGDCSLFLNHVKENICSNVEEYYTYILGWMARLIQHPDSAGQVAIVLRGRQGTGKSIFARMLGSLLGRHFIQVSDAKHMVGSFNAHLRDSVLFFSDEAFYAGDKKHESVLKTLITEETIIIESKGVDAEVSPNYNHLILASNNNWVVPAGADERRFFVVDINDQRKQDTAYFRAMVQQMDTGGREALLYYLLNYDISNYEVRSVPRTSALQEQKLLSLNPEEEWWYNKLANGQILDTDETWRREIIKKTVIDDFVEYARRFSISRRATETALGKFLKKVCPTMSTVQRNAKIMVHIGDGYEREVMRRVYMYIFPELSECRRRWTEQYGIDDWGLAVTQEQTEPQEEIAPTRRPF